MYQKHNKSNSFTSPSCVNYQGRTLLQKSDEKIMNIYIDLFQKMFMCVCVCDCLCLYGCVCVPMNFWETEGVPLSVRVCVFVRASVYLF